jgi:Putative Ig domain
VLKRSLTAFCILLCWFALSCGSTKSPNNSGGGQSGFKFVTPTSSPAIDVGESVTLTVSEPATWSLQAGNGLTRPVGTLSTTTAATSVTYSVPSGVALPNNTAAQDVVVATSAADTTETAALVVVVNPPVSLQTLSTHLTSNQDCSYDPVLANNDGSVGSAYVPGAEVGSLAVAGGTAPYTWSISSGALPAGLILQSTTGKFCGNAPSCAFLSGTPVTSACSQVALQVTDATGATATSPTYFVVVTPAPLKVQVPLYSDLYQAVAYPPTALSVTGGVGPYIWSVTDPVNDPLPTGMSLTTMPQNTTSAYLSGTPSLTSFLTPSLLVIDSQAPYPAVGTASLNLNEWLALSSPCTPDQGFSTNNASLQGSYAFLLRGFDSTGPMVIAGSFTADGAGNVSGGVEDVMRSGGSQANLAIQPASSSYAIFEQTGDTGNFSTRGCATLTAGGTTQTFAFSLGGCTTSIGNFGLCNSDSQGTPGVFTTGRIIEFDGGGQLSGIIRRQDTSAFSTGLSGLYAFGLSGRDLSGGRFASAGSFSASGGTLASVAADINDAGSLQSSLTGGTGSASSFDANGRGTATVNVGTATLNLAMYAVSGQDVLLASTGSASAANPLISGEAVATTGPFNAASLQNSQMFHVAGLSPGGPDPSIGLLSFDGTGFFSGTQFEDQAGTLSTTALSGTYLVDSNTGRFALINQNNNVVIVHPLVGYAIPVPTTLTRQNCAQPANCITGFLLSTDATAQAGLLEFQTPAIGPPPPFTNLYVSGYYFYATDESLDPETPLFEGATNAVPNGAVYSGIQSASYPTTSFYCQLEPACAALFPNQTLSSKGTYSVSSNGTVSIGGETVAVTNGNVIFYIDESPLNSHPAVMVVEQ